MLSKGSFGTTVETAMPSHAESTTVHDKGAQDDETSRFRILKMIP
jgi:hypothetical protein